MRRLLLAALCVASSAVTALAGGIPNAPEGATAVESGGLWYWLLSNGVMLLIT